MPGFSQTDIWWYHLGKYYEKGYRYRETFSIWCSNNNVSSCMWILFNIKDKNKKGK